MRDWQRQSHRAPPGTALAACHIDSQQALARGASSAGRGRERPSQVTVNDGKPEMYVALAYLIWW